MGVDTKWLAKHFEEQETRMTQETNTGNDNPSNYHVGCFNTVHAEKTYYLNKPIDKRLWDEAEKPSWIHTPAPTSWASSVCTTYQEKEERMSDEEVIERLREWPFMGKAMATAAADHIEQLAAINEALIAERDEAWKRAGHAEKMWGETEVKLSESEALLAKALEGLRYYAQEGDDGGWLANDILTELTGGKDG